MSVITVPPRTGIIVNPALCVVKMSAAYIASTFTITTGTDTPVFYDEDDYDPLGCHSIVADQTKIFVPAGYNRARATSQFGFTTHSTGFRRLSIEKNDSVLTGSAFLSTNANASPTPTFLNATTGWMEVVEGDYISSYVLQNSGGDLFAQGAIWMQVEFSNV